MEWPAHLPLDGGGGVSGCYSKFSGTKSFCFENNVLLTFGLGMREGVSEGSRCGYG